MAKAWTVLFLVILSLEGVVAAPRDATFLGKNVAPDSTSLLMQLLHSQAHTEQDAGNLDILHKLYHELGISDQVQEMLKDPEISTKISNLAQKLMENKHQFPMISQAILRIASNLQSSNSTAILEQVIETTNHAPFNQTGLDTEQLLSLWAQLDPAGSVKIEGPVPLYLVSDSCITAGSKSVALLCSSNNKDVTVSSYYAGDCQGSATVKSYPVPYEIKDLGSPFTVTCDPNVAGRASYVTVSVFGGTSCSSGSLLMQMTVRADDTCRSGVRMRCEGAQVIYANYGADGCNGTHVNSTISNDNCVTAGSQSMRFVCFDSTGDTSDFGVGASLSNSNNSVVVGILILMILAGGLGGAYYYRRRQKAKAKAAAKVKEEAENQDAEDETVQTERDVSIESAEPKASSTKKHKHTSKHKKAKKHDDEDDCE